MTDWAISIGLTYHDVGYEVAFNDDGDPLKISVCCGEVVDRIGDQLVLVSEYETIWSVSQRRLPTAKELRVIALAAYDLES
jgi:hypothetical protein